MHRWDAGPGLRAEGARTSRRRVARRLIALLLVLGGIGGLIAGGWLAFWTDDADRRLIALLFVGGIAAIAIGVLATRVARPPDRFAHREALQRRRVSAAIDRRR